MNPTSRSSKNSNSADRISVLSLNLRFGLADDGPNSWIYRKESYPSLLEKYRTDIIGFQEVNNFQADFLKNILSEYSWIGERKSAPEFWQDNIIFYHKDWECIYQDHFYLSTTPDIPSRFQKSKWPRQCTIGIFKNKQGKLIVANTHFDFDIDVQVQSALLIMKRLSEISSKDPIILIGDFNAAPHSPGYNVFTGENPNEASGSDLYFKNAFKKPYPGTFHGFNDDKTGDHIDWILYRGELIPVESSTLQMKINGFYPSDHFPVFSVFNRRNEER